MTKKQKARAHLARAKQLLQQHSLAFGVKKEESMQDADLNAVSGYENLPEDILLKILNGIGAKSTLVAKQVNHMHFRLTKEILEEAARDDQFLINALQKKDNQTASLLLQHRYQQPQISKQVIPALGRHHDASYGNIIQRILVDALNIHRTIELRDLTLTSVGSVVSCQHSISITKFRETDMFHPNIGPKVFEGEDNRGQAVDIRLSPVARHDEIIYDISERGLHYWQCARFYARLELGPIPESSTSEEMKDR